MTTPSLEAMVNDLIDQRLRQMQTSYPAEVVSYDNSNSTVTVKPLFLETWRGPNDERLSETFDEPEDAYVENVIVAFPRMGAGRIVFPIAAGDTGLVIVTKYTLDRFREGGGESDPGDLRLFGMSGSVFFPVNLTPDGDALDASEGSANLYLGEGGTGDYLALKKDVDDIKTYLDEIKADFNQHTHVYSAGPTAGQITGTAGASTPASSITSTYTPTYSKNVKAESN